MRIVQVVVTELQKLRRSKVPGLTLLAFALGPLGTGLFMWIVREPDRAARLGLLGSKADLLGLEASWAGYLEMLVQMVGIVGGLVLAVVAAYVFGREYAEGTAKNLLALPVPRWHFVAGKFVITAAWWLAMVAVVLIEALAVGWGLGLPEFSASVVWAGSTDIFLAALVSLLLVPMVAWIATVGRGYLPPLGFAMLTLVLGNVMGATGWGKWVPWTVVPLYAGVAGPRVETLAPRSLAVVLLTCVVGVAATVAQVRWGENSQ